MIYSSKNLGIMWRSSIYWIFNFLFKLTQKLQFMFIFAKKLSRYQLLDLFIFRLKFGANLDKKLERD